MNNKFTGSTLAIVVGLISIVGTLSQFGAATPPTTTPTWAGVPMILGGLAYMARKKQFLSPSAKWQAVEVISILLLLFHVFSGISNSTWYVNPVEVVFIPLWAAIAYGVLILRARGFHFTSPKKTRTSELEELASLRDKGIHTPQEFAMKKRQILDL